MVTTTLEQEIENEQHQERPRDREAVEQLAYRFWQERGCPEGSPEEDWNRAERELKG